MVELYAALEYKNAIDAQGENKATTFTKQEHYDVYEQETISKPFVKKLLAIIRLYPLVVRSVPIILIADQNSGEKG